MSVPLILLDQQRVGQPQPVTPNRIDYSKLLQVETPIRLSGFSIKYVTKGVENYTINGHHYPVKQGQYLLVGPGQNAKVWIDSPTPVEGMCLVIAPEIIHEVIAARVVPDLPDMALWQGQHWADGLLQVQYRPAPNARIGVRMRHLAHLVQHQMANVSQFDLPFFYALAEDYLVDYSTMTRQIAAIPAVKPSTRQELFRRVTIGRHYLEDCFEQSLSIPQAAREAMLSQYQFFRLFKNIYGISPHQYLLNKRLETGKCLLQAEKMTLSAVAQKTGFADAHALSKAFKKHFGITPGTCKRQLGYQGHLPY